MTAKNVVIKSSESRYVLDAKEAVVTLQHFTGALSQLWTIQPVELGTNFIVNKGNGKILDIQGGINKGANIITYLKHGRPNQLWYINSDHTIVSSVGNLAVDVGEAKYFPGEKLLAYPKHDGAIQKFFLQYK